MNMKHKVHKLVILSLSHPRQSMCTIQMIYYQTLNRDGNWIETCACARLVYNVDCMHLVLPAMYVP